MCKDFLVRIIKSESSFRNKNYPKKAIILVRRMENEIPEPCPVEEVQTDTETDHTNNAHRQSSIDSGSKACVSDETNDVSPGSKRNFKISQVTVKSKWIKKKKK